MFNRKQVEEEPRPLEKALDELVAELGNHDGHTKEYTTLINNVRVLCSMPMYGRHRRKKPSINPDAAGCADRGQPRWDHHRP